MCDVCARIQAGGGTAYLLPTSETIERLMDEPKYKARRDQMFLELLTRMLRIATDYPASEWAEFIIAGIGCNVLAEAVAEGLTVEQVKCPQDGPEAPRFKAVLDDFRTASKKLLDDLTAEAAKGTNAVEQAAAIVESVFGAAAAEDMRKRYG